MFLFGFITYRCLCVRYGFLAGRLALNRSWLSRLRTVTADVLMTRTCWSRIDDARRLRMASLLERRPSLGVDIRGLPLRCASFTSSGFKRCLLRMFNTVLIDVSKVRAIATPLIPAGCMLMTRHLCPTVVRPMSISYSRISVQYLMSCGRHRYFIWLWDLDVSFAAHFSNLPYLRQSLSRNAITKFTKFAVYIIKHYILMHTYNFLSCFM